MWNRNRWNLEILSGIGIAKNFEVELESVSESRKILNIEIKFSKTRKSVTKGLIKSIEGGAIIDIKAFYIAFCNTEPENENFLKNKAL